MSLGPGERWIWVGIGALTVLVLHTAASQLRNVRKATEVDQTKKKWNPNSIGPLTEDALKLDTLEKLASGPRGGTRDAAIVIICERAATGHAYPLILEQVASPIDDIRSRALDALSFLSHSPAARNLCTFSTYHTLTTALTYTLQDTDRATRPLGRQSSERVAMAILTRILPYHLSLALRAGLVTRWLAQYPFGPDPASRRQAIKHLRSWSAGDDLLSQIICLIEGSAEGRGQMRTAGLFASDIDEDAEGDSFMIGGDDTAARPGSMSTRRRREESMEERLVRRRRREAMVLSDGVLPLGSQDIIQRGDGGVMDDEVERQLEELMDHERREDRWRLPWRLE